jgi:hypothetical protein
MFLVLDLCVDSLFLTRTRGRGAVVCLFGRQAYSTSVGPNRERCLDGIFRSGGDGHISPFTYGSTGNADKTDALLLVRRISNETIDDWGDLCSSSLCTDAS